MSGSASGYPPLLPPGVPPGTAGLAASGITVNRSTRSPGMRCATAGGAPHPDLAEAVQQSSMSCRQAQVGAAGHPALRLPLGALVSLALRQIEQALSE